MTTEQDVQGVQGAQDAGEDLGSYIEGNSESARQRRLAVLKKFVSFVEGGHTHSKAVTLTEAALGYAVSRGQILSGTKAWRNAHPEPKVEKVKGKRADADLEARLVLRAILSELGVDAQTWSEALDWARKARP